MSVLRALSSIGNIIGYITGATILFIGAMFLLVKFLRRFGIDPSKENPGALRGFLQNFD